MLSIIECEDLSLLNTSSSNQFTHIAMVSSELRIPYLEHLAFVHNATTKFLYRLPKLLSPDRKPITRSPIGMYRLKMALQIKSSFREGFTRMHILLISAWTSTSLFRPGTHDKHYYLFYQWRGSFQEYWFPDYTLATNICLPKMDFHDKIYNYVMAIPYIKIYSNCSFEGRPHHIFKCWI